MFNRYLKYCLVIGIIFNFSYCNNSTDSSGEESSNKSGLIEVSSTSFLWTGVAVSKEGRIFVCFPRWSLPIQMSVGEISNSTTPVPYPNKEWNNWSEAMTAIGHFVCVQSVFIDDDNYLWILDTGSPRLKGVIYKGAKLLKVDISSNQIIDVYELDDYFNTNTYLNDVRINKNSNYAYITDSGLGSIIIVDLLKRTSRKVLSNGASTKAEGISLTIEGISFTSNVHADGLALDSQREYLYYKALKGNKLYRIRTEWLNYRDTVLTEIDLNSKVEYVANVGATDAIEFGPDGNLYLTSIEMNAIRRYKPDGNIEVVIQDSKIKWPDSFSITSDGKLYFTTSQIHRLPHPTGPFRLFKLNL